MTLNNTSFTIDRVDHAQVERVQNAGGSRLSGDFSLAPGGWEITFTCLTFQELVKMAEAARRIVES